MLCPRGCGSFRSAPPGSGRSPYCGESSTIRVAYVGPHFGEEPPLSGSRGSGAVFFSGCPLKCSYCQNHQITRGGIGERVSLRELFRRVTAMINDFDVHNISMVTPDHFFPDVFQLVEMLREGGCRLPIVYNLSGYQSVEMISEAESRADIYLPDFKYSDRTLAARLSGCGDYPSVALSAVCEMVRQKGFLDRCEGDGTPAGRGVLVRHLILPGHVENSLASITSLFVEFGGELPLSIMSQYRPVVPQKYRELNRTVTPDEFRRVYELALELGFRHLFVQIPDAGGDDETALCPFVPDFGRDGPFLR